MARATVLMAALVVTLRSASSGTVAPRSGKNVCMTGYDTYQICDNLCDYPQLELAGDNCTEQRSLDSATHHSDVSSCDVFIAMGNFTSISQRWIPADNKFQIFIYAFNSYQWRRNDFLRMPSVKWMQLQHNDIEEIEEDVFSGLLNLTKVSMSGNLIRTLVSFGNLTYLEELSLDYNRIEDVKAYAFAQYPNLKDLTLESNQIANIEQCAFCGLRKLHKLNLDVNRLTALPARFTRDMKQLKELSLKGNGIVAITNDTFAEPNSNLRKLFLSNNVIVMIHPQAFAQLKKLQKLFLNGNALVSIKNTDFAGLNALKYLNLDHNMIMHVGSGFLDRCKAINNFEMSLKKNIIVCPCLVEIAEILGAKLKGYHNDPTNYGCTLPKDNNASGCKKFWSADELHTQEGDQLKFVEG